MGLSKPDRPLGALVVGGGPAGCAVLLAARKLGALNELIASGVRIVERTDTLGSGELGDYRIRSDSFAESFLKPLDADAEPPLRHLLSTPAGAYVDARRGQPVELTVAAELLAEMAVELRGALRAEGADPFVTGAEILRANRRTDGAWLALCRRGAEVETFVAWNLVLATGAEQPIRRLHEIEVAGFPLLPRFCGKTVQSAELLGLSGPKRLADALSGRGSPKVAIVGGSHSAFSCALVCLGSPSGSSFGPRSIAILHPEPLRSTYASPAEALADGFDAFGEEDICPKTGRVFPLAGFRSDSRELLRRCLGLGGQAREERLLLLRLETDRFAEANSILDEADLIVAALGYRPRALPLFDTGGQPIRFLAETGASPLVDVRSRVLDAVGRAVPGVFALGLSAGYPLAGTHGEPSFTGEANGLALWQGDIGEDLVRQLLERRH